MTLSPMPAPIRRTGRLVGLATLIVYLATTGGSMATDTMSYEVTRAIVEQGSVAMSGKVLNLDAHVGVDGRYYAPYGIGHALFSVPFYLVGRSAELQLGFSVGRSDAVRKAAFVAGSAVASALVVWIVFLFAWRLSGHRSAAVATALTVAFGTLLWPYAKYGFNAPLGTLAVVGGVYATWLGVRATRSGVLLVAGAAFGGALLVRPELALAGVVAAVWAALEVRDWRRVARIWTALAAPALVAVGVMFIYNYVRFGDVRDTGYLRDSGAAFSEWRARWEGFAGLLVSPGRSLFLYSPVTLPAIFALAGWFRRDRSTALLLLGVCGSLFVFYASLEYWDADRSYGPRYLLPVIPLLCLSLVSWFADASAHRVLPWVVAVSVLVQIPGIAMDFTKAGPALGVTHPLLERRWNWRVAGLTTNTRALAHYLPANLRYVAGAATPPAVRPSAGRDAGFSEQFGYSLDFWWLYLFYFDKLSRLMTIAVAMSFAGAAGWLLWRLRRPE